MYKRKLYQILASLVDARATCAKTGNTEWYDKHEERAEGLVKDYMPHGSGFDSGTSLDWDKSTGNHLVFNAPYHHMDENGYYDGWTDHQVITTPDLASGFDIRITGKDRDGTWKDYATDLFHEALSTEITE